MVNEGNWDKIEEESCRGNCLGGSNLDPQKFSQIFEFKSKN